MRTKIVIIADDKRYMGILREFFEFKIPDCQVNEVHARDKLPKDEDVPEADAFLVDYNLGSVESIPLVINIRGMYPKARILVFTMYLTVGVEKNALEAGADKVLEEPLTSNRLHQLITA